MHKIIPHLWFDKEAKEAAELYISAFKQNSSIVHQSTLNDTPSGTVGMLTIDLFGQRFMFLNAGPYFTFNPSISFIVACETTEEAEDLWRTLSVGGKALMEFGSYPFSDAYGWTEDRFGVSWQIMYTSHYQMKQKITPTLMFVGENCGKAENAINFYTSVFKDASIGTIARYTGNEGQDKEGTIMHAGFVLNDTSFAIMDSAYPHAFTFNESISFVVSCDTQDEIDYYWDKLSAHPESEQCGWLKDQYGVSWQIVPSIMNQMLAGNDQARINRVTKAFLQMKKFDIAKLQEAYDQE